MANHAALAAEPQDRGLVGVATPSIPSVVRFSAASITNEAAEALPAAAGQTAHAVIKASDCSVKAACNVCAN
jgi:hypothetical protein